MAEEATEGETVENDVEFGNEEIWFGTMLALLYDERVVTGGFVLISSIFMYVPRSSEGGRMGETFFNGGAVMGLDEVA